MISFLISILPCLFIKDYSFIDKKHKKLYIGLYLLFIFLACSFVYSKLELVSTITNLIGVLLSYKLVLDIVNGDLDKNKLLKIFLIIVIYLGVSLILGTLLGFYAGYKNIPIDNISEKANVVLELLSQLILVIIFTLMYKKDLIKDFKDFKKNYSKYLPKAIGTFLVALVISELINIVLILVTGLKTSVNEEIVQGLIQVAPVLSIISMGFFAPFVEEIVFRKSHYEAFKYNKNLFIIASAISFGLAHVIFSATTLSEWAFGISYIILGGALAKCYADSDNFFTSFIVHMLNNIVVILISIFL